MILKKYLNGLPVLGLLAMLIACPTAGGKVGDDGELSADDPYASKFKTLQDEIKGLQDGAKKFWGEDEVKKAIVAGIIIDPTKPDAVWKKVTEIMKESQSQECSPFYPNLMLVPQVKSGPKGGKLIFKPAQATGGGGTLTKIVGKGELADDEFLYFEYDNYSIDGIYKISGKFDFKTKVISAPAAGKSHLVASAASKGYKLEAASTLTFEPVDKTNKFAGFTETLKKVDLKFETFGFDVGNDGTACPKVSSDAKVTVTSATKKVLAVADFKGLFGETSGTASTGLNT